MSPKLENMTLPTPHFDLNHGTYLAIKTQSFQLNEKLIYLKKLMYLMYTNFWILTQDRHTLTAHGTPSVACDATYAYSGLSWHAYLTNKHNHLKMRG